MNWGTRGSHPGEVTVVDTSLSGGGGGGGGGWKKISRHAFGSNATYNFREILFACNPAQTVGTAQSEFDFEVLEVK